MTLLGNPPLLKIFVLKSLEKPRKKKKTHENKQMKNSRGQFDTRGPDTPARSRASFEQHSAVSLCPRLHPNGLITKVSGPRGRGKKSQDLPSAPSADYSQEETASFPNCWKLAWVSLMPSKEDEVS